MFTGAGASSRRPELSSDGDRRATSVGKALSVLEAFGARDNLLGVTEVAMKRFGLT